MTDFPRFPLQFITNQGLGDSIYQTVAIQYCIENYPQTTGKIIANDYFYPLAKLWFKKYEPRFAVRDVVQPQLPMLAPRRDQPNANGFHLLDIAFMYYANQEVPAGWHRMPIINGDEADISKFKLPEKYVVITTNATAENRMLTAQCIIETAAKVKDLGYTPVYLGKHQISKQQKYNSFCPEGLTLDGIDLRDKTTVVEAACILANAKCVIGLDNGLLHLAACSMVPIVFAMTITRPEHRAPYRRDGARTVIVVPPEEVECRFCTQNVRFGGTSTTDCYTGTLKCVKSMTSVDLIKAFEGVMCETSFNK